MPRTDLTFIGFERPERGDNIVAYRGNMALGHISCLTLDGSFSISLVLGQAIIGKHGIDTLDEAKDEFVALLEDLLQQNGLMFDPAFTPPPAPDYAERIISEAKIFTKAKEVLDHMQHPMTQRYLREMLPGTRDRVRKVVNRHYAALRDKEQAEEEAHHG